MIGLNRVFLMGYLGADPEPRTTQNGKPYARLRLATTHRWKDATGKTKEVTEWHRVLVWGRRATNCQTYLHKGSPVAVEGEISSFKSHREGAENQPPIVTIMAKEIHFIPSAKPLDRSGESGNPIDVVHPDSPTELGEAVEAL